MASTNGRESSKMTASVDSLKLSSKATSKNSSKHASSESVLSKKDKECLQMQECKKKLLAMEPQVIIRDDNVVLRSPPQKKIVMPPTINPEVRFIYNYQISQVTSTNQVDELIISNIKYLCLRTCKFRIYVYIL